MCARTQSMCACVHINKKSEPGKQEAHHVLNKAFAETSVNRLQALYQPISICKCSGDQLQLSSISVWL